MGKIFCLMGKSAAGKDTIFKRLQADFPHIKSVIMYTTRPIREHEKNGQEYFFVDREERKRLEEEGKVIECRTYQTTAGPWDYFTVDDGQIDLKKSDYLMLGTLESYEKMRSYFGKEALYPLYIELDDGLRLLRAIEREKEQPHPDYREICRRFLADDRDFSEENLKRLGISHRYCNNDLSVCLKELEEDIRANSGYRENAGIEQNTAAGGTSHLNKCMI